jgi:hypothetical protein
MLAAMSILCLFGRHVPSAASITHAKRGGYRALCDGCGLPIERQDRGSWRPVEPLAKKVGAHR